MATIAARMGDVEPNAAILIAVGFFVAFSVKLGLFPFHFWLPTVYTGAPAGRRRDPQRRAGQHRRLRAAALRRPSCCRDELALAATALIVIGCASILYGGVLAVSRRTASEMLAYSAIGQVGYVLVALGVGGPVGFAAAILYTIVNALNKTLLFLTVQMRGALVGAAFALGAFSVAGVPPAAGFIGKLELFRDGRRQPRAPRSCSSLGGALSFVYAFQVYQYDFWRGERVGPRSGARQQAVDRRPRAARPRRRPVARAAARAQPRRRAGARRRRPVIGILVRAAGLAGDLPARPHERRARRRARRRPARARGGARPAPAGGPAPAARRASRRGARPPRSPCWRPPTRWSAGAGAPPASASAAGRARVRRDPARRPLARGRRALGRAHGRGARRDRRGRRRGARVLDRAPRSTPATLTRCASGTGARTSATCGRWCLEPCLSSCWTIAVGWATLLLVAGGVLLLRARDTLHRVLALDVLVAILIALLTILSYLRDVSYYIDAALALALLSFTATLVAARYVTRGGPF